MISKEEAREKIKKLIEEFSENPKYWDSKPEEDIKFQFIEPLFEALGWERKEISKEQRVLKGRADYILKLGNQEVLVIEAKKTNVMLMDDEGRQAVSYAYHRKIKFSVLTNFKNLRVYHALSNIKDIGRNLLKVNNNYFDLKFNEFIDKFDILWLLSKEGFEKGEINKLLSSKDEKLNKSIDANILEDLLHIRELLSKELKSKKNYLEKETIDEIVQIFIDRLIFIRSVEDRGLEPMNYLRSLESDVKQQRTKLQLFHYILEKFDEFNQKYDSKLFEKGLLEKEGVFSDDVLRKVILTLYFGRENNQERYLFDQIPGDLFGSIYEQYLGTILAGTDKRVKMDSSSGKRKKMGIYYTPSYIVDYIVKNTVHEYIKDKTIDEILEVNILDPACGSGSFITRAFVEVCNVVKEKLNNEEEGSKALFKKPKTKLEELNLGQKIEILRNCIYGVDLDEKAVELARLNLLLKLLEGETQETRKMLLPHLENNIKCGNSLIDDAKVSDRAFNWRAQFPDVFRNGGFDIVVGNPPYVSQKGTENKPNIEYLEREHYRKYYKTLSENELKTRGGVKLNLFGLWIEKGINILRQKGEIGLIVHKNLLKVESYKFLRKCILDNSSIKEIADLGANIFEGVTGETIILIICKDKDKFNKIKVKTETNLQNNIYKENTINQNNFYENPDFTFNIYETSFIEDLKRRLSQNSKKLEELYSIVSFGLNTSDNKKYFVPTQINQKYKKAVMGRNISKWIIKSYGYVFYDTKVLTRKGDIKSFEAKEKLILQRIGAELISCYDDQQLYCYNSTNMILTKEKAYSLKYLLGLINSKLINFYYKNVFSMNSSLTVNITQGYLSQIRIHLPSSPQEHRIISLVNSMLELQKKYHDEKIAGGKKERLKQQIDNKDYEINEEVYKLYGITDEEKKIIEESLK